MRPRGYKSQIDMLLLLSLLSLLSLSSSSSSSSSIIIHHHPSSSSSIIMHHHPSSSIIIIHHHHPSSWAYVLLLLSLLLLWLSPSRCLGMLFALWLCPQRLSPTITDGNPPTPQRSRLGHSAFRVVRCPFFPSEGEIGPYGRCCGRGESAVGLADFHR